MSPTLTGLAVALLLVSTFETARAAGPWTLSAGAVAGTPISPSEFSADWGAGFGLGGGLRRSIGRRTMLGIEAEFLQFGLGGVAGTDVTGGARRFGRFAVPLTVRLWDHPGLHAGRIDLVTSAGYAHESIDSITGTSPSRRDRRADGLAWTVGLAYSRVLYQSTRLAFGARHARFEAPEDSAGHLDAWLAAEVPLGQPGR